MRVSADDKSPDFWRLKFSKCPIILLDGNSVDTGLVTMADDGLGIVERGVRGANGYFATEGDQFVIETLRGKVQIIGTPSPMGWTR